MAIMDGNHFAITTQFFRRLRLTEPLSLRAVVTFRIDGGHQFRLIDVRKKSYRFVSRECGLPRAVIICRGYGRRCCPALWRARPTLCVWVIGSLVNYVRAGYAHDFE